MRKLVALVIVGAVAWVAWNGSGSVRVSDDTRDSADAFVCGVAESTRTALSTGGEAARAAAGVIADNTSGRAQELARRVVDAPDNAAARQALQTWVTDACR